VEGFPVPGHRARIIAVANQKGGVGKSTTAVNLGAALAEDGATVLLIDMDPQGNASTGLGIPPQERTTTTYQVMASGVAADRAVMPTALERLSAIPSTIDLAGAEIELVSQFSREMRLSRALDGVANTYDYVILDCPPSLGLLTVNSLAAADELIVPIQCEYYALEGLGQLLRNVRLVQQNLNPGLRLTGIVLTMYDSRTKLAEQVVAEVRRYFGSRVYDTLIPRSVRLSEAPGYGQPITAYDGGSKGAKAYRALAREVAAGPREADAPIPTEDMPEVILPEPTPDEDAQGEEDEGDDGKRRRRLFGRKGGET
jgi:chromosome partitioning protein